MSVAVSVIVPTHNRRRSVLRLLRALERQTPIHAGAPFQSALDGGFEVVVVADGCSDGTVEALAAAAPRFALTIVEQPPSGPSVARNAGAERASGAVLLFLDDDVEPLAGVLQAHVAFHARSPRAIAVGDLPPRVEVQGYFGTILPGWLTGMYDGPRQPGHRYVYRNMLTGHCSIRREEFEALGGFDAALRCHEDWELAYRAIAAGIDLRFLPDAVAYHHDATTLPKTLQRKFDEGVADVQLIARYPSLARDLPLGRPQAGGVRRRVLERLAWRAPAVGRVAARALRMMLPLYEAARLRFRWRALLEDLFEHAYWRGVAQAAGARSALAALLERAPAAAAPELTVDLAHGIAAARAELDRCRPQSVRLLYGDEAIADIPADPGAERLRGDHLPRIIARCVTLEYLRAASRAGAIPATLSARCGPSDPTAPPHRGAEPVAALGTS